MKTWQPEPSVFNLVYDPIIGENVSLVNTLLDCVNQITIGNNVSFGHNVMVLTGYHDYTLMGAERMASSLSKPVVIEDGAWIASGAIILPGVTIGKDAVVCAGAVVTRDVGPREMWGGVPAVPIKYISKYPKSPCDFVRDTGFANYIVGFVDGEGYFSKSRNGIFPFFRFGIELNRSDKGILEKIQGFFGCGQISTRNRKEGWKVVRFVIGDSEHIRARVIPFFDNYEPRAKKRIQYQRWREEFLDYKSKRYGEKGEKVEGRE